MPGAIVGGAGGAGVVDSLDGNQTNYAPSVRAVKTGLSAVSGGKQAPFIVDLYGGSGAVTTGTKKASAWASVGGAVKSVVAYLDTASSSGLVTIDVKVGGVSILGVPLTIDANELSSRTAATAVTLISSSFIKEEALSFDVTGAGNGAAGLLVRLYCEDDTDGISAPEVTLHGVIAGTPVVGQVLTFTPSTATGAVSRSRQWYRNKTPISGATGLTYTLVSGDIHADISCVETITGSTGFTTSRSNAIYVITVPTVVSAPSIAGTAFLAQNLTLNLGSYSDGGVVTAYSWERNSSALGDTDDTHTVLQADVGASIVAALTVTNAAGSAVFRTAAVVPTGPAYGGAELSALSADAFVSLTEPATGGDTYVDPTYGLTVRRATDYTVDAVGSGYVRHVSSRQPVFNSDASRYIAQSSDGRWIVYNASTGVPVNVITMDQGAEPIWHPTNPDIVWHTAAFGGLVWYARNVTNDTATTLVDFTGRLGSLSGAARVWLRGGCPSADGRFWAFSVESAALVHLGIITWDRVGDEILGSMPAGSHNGGSPEWLSVGPSGDYAVISWAGANGTRSYGIGLDEHIDLVASAPYGDLCVGSSGQDVFCYFDEAAHSIRVADCATGASYTLMSLTWGSGSSQEITNVSISGKAFARPGWVFLSCYGERYLDSTYAGSLSTVRAPWRKVFVARLAASGSAYNVAHTQSSTEYGGAIGAPDAVPSKDGLKCIWASNFGDGDDVDLFMTTLPDVLVAGTPTAPAFSGTPTITSVSGIYETGQTLQVNIGTVTGEPFPTISYQWKLGSTNVGTDSDTITPSTAGNYSCVVTLTNSQGSTNATASAVAVAAPNVALSTRVRSAHNLGQSNYLSAATPSFAVAAGEMIVVAVAFEDYPATITASVSDSAGNTYTSLPAVVCPDKESRVQVFYCLSSVASSNNVVTASTPNAAIPTTQVRATVYNAGAGRHFTYDKEVHAAAGFSYGDLSTSAFNTPGQGVIYAAFANNYTAGTGWPNAAPSGWTYIDNVGQPLVSMEKITLAAATGVVATMPVGADYSRGSLQAVSFLSVPN